MNQIIKSGIIRAFTYKAGILSAVAHDLRLTLQKFEVEVSGQKVKGTFWPASFHLDGAIKNGKLTSGLLLSQYEDDIYKNMNDKIMFTKKYPEIIFEGKFDREKAEGQLSMVGRTAPVSVPLKLQDGHISGKVELVPTRWGIPPFKAMMGTIRLQDRVLLEFDLPYEGTVESLFA